MLLPKGGRKRDQLKRYEYQDHYPTHLAIEQVENDLSHEDFHQSFKDAGYEEKPSDCICVEALNVFNCHSGFDENDRGQDNEHPSNGDVDDTKYQIDDRASYVTGNNRSYVREDGRNHCSLT